MIKLYICEKPDVARAVAQNLNQKITKKDGYFQVGNNLVTYAFGHLLRLQDPEEYNEKYKRWDLENLPIKVDEFKYKPIDKSKDQLKIVLSLIKDKSVDEIVHCGDPDEEGQILIDEILHYAKCNKKVSRVLISDNTDEGVKKALNNAKPNESFLGLSESGFTRSQADWIVGLNLTRAYTIKAKKIGFKGVLSVGRVQTPILALIVKRDLENKLHIKEKYFSLTAYFNVNGIDFKARPKLKNKLTDKVYVDEILNSCIDKSGMVVKANHEVKLDYPELPYSLLNLQIEASKRFGYKPD